MNYEELVKSGKNIGDMTKEELFEYCYGLLGEVWNFEKEIERLNNIINELEQENKVLLEKYSTIQILYNSSKLKNDKAIKYIKEHIRIDDEYPAYMEMLVEEKDELLNILQGGDK